MKEETRRELLAFEEKNARIFQVMGSLKLLNLKVKAFVRRLEKIAEDDETTQRNLNEVFQGFQRDLQFFQQEHKRLIDADLHIASVDVFAQNAGMLFPHEKKVYSILEMRRISVYMYRMADMMLKELAEKKNENEEKIHDIHAKNGKYYFNRK